MTETKGKKALSLCILRVLEQRASERNPLSTRHIIEFLKEDFGMIAERKAVGTARAITLPRSSRPKANPRCRTIPRRSTPTFARPKPRRTSAR